MWCCAGKPLPCALASLACAGLRLDRAPAPAALAGASLQCLGAGVLELCVQTPPPALGSSSSKKANRFWSRTPPRS